MKSNPYVYRVAPVLISRKIWKILKLKEIVSKANEVL